MSRHQPSFGCLFLVAVSVRMMLPMLQTCSRGAEPVPLVQIGTIRGQLLQTDGQASRTPAVAVFVCDALSGIPLLAANGETIGRLDDFSGLDGLAHEMTDEDGQFAISNIAAGEYRLVAQSWSGRTSVSTMKDPDTTLLLHGVANDITVKAGATTDVSIKALGRSEMVVQNSPDEGNNFLFVGLRPPLGQPILGPMLCGDDYTRNVAGVTHMKGGRQLVRGLPNDAEVHLSLLNYDNNPGIGGVSGRTGRDHEVKLLIYATWSNGHYRPPAHMKPLVDWVREYEISLPDLMTGGQGDQFTNERGRRNYRRYYSWIKEHAQEKVQVGDLGEFRVIDLAATESYRRYAKSHEARQEANKTPP